MEVLFGVFWELLEEEGKEGIDVLSSGDSVANGVAAVRVADIYFTGSVSTSLVMKVWIYLADQGR